VRDINSHAANTVTASQCLWDTAWWVNLRHTQHLAC